MQLWPHHHRDRQRNTGMISCSVCLEDFQTAITCELVSLCVYGSYSLSCSLSLRSDLSEAVDVYSDWIDACESANA